MLAQDELSAAVAAGIVTAAQADALREFASRRERERAVELGHEERFRFMSGFNDFFFAIGVVLLSSGLAAFTFAVPVTSLISAAIVWALAELLVGRMRRVLPGILLACIFVAFILLASPVDFWFAPSTQQPPGFDALRDWFTRQRVPLKAESMPLMLSIYALVGAAAALLFYARFRLPFALLLVAGSLVAAALATVHHYWPQPAKSIEALTLLGCGLVVFAAAMTFDASDRERLTRRADCAFWLHLLAAPLIVHSLIELVWLRLPGGTRATEMTTEVTVEMAVIVTVLAIIAIIVDRRALLVSGLAYLGIAIGFALSGAFGGALPDKAIVFPVTLLILGVMVLTLGVGWMPVRRRLIALLSSGLVNRLPPVPVRS